jgi:uncharacterized protein (DUF1697 family)
MFLRRIREPSRRARTGKPGEAGRIGVWFYRALTPNDARERINCKDDEAVQLGKREIYVRYGENMGRSNLKIPAAKAGTPRNINAVASLADMTAEL